MQRNERGRSERGSELYRWPDLVITVAMSLFFQRGGAWVLAQATLILAVVTLAVKIHGTGHIAQSAVGSLLLAAGLAVMIVGARALGRSLTPFPKPAEAAQFVDHGIYAFIRHPLYTGGMLVLFGWALLWQSWPALVAALISVPFFNAKARREEQWLCETFLEYPAYMKRVRRFVPWVY